MKFTQWYTLLKTVNVFKFLFLFSLLLNYLIHPNENKTQNSHNSLILSFYKYISYEKVASSRYKNSIVSYLASYLIVYYVVCKEKNIVVCVHRTNYLKRNKTIYKLNTRSSIGIETLKIGRILSNIMSLIFSINCSYCAN